MNQLHELSEAMANAVAGTAESVLRVEARRRLPASGIAWAENLLVTAHHVVEYEDEIVIGLGDGRQTSAVLLGRDPHNDLALLQVEGALSVPNWGRDADLRVGHLVLALGRPAEKVRASLGVVSGLIEPADIKRKWERAEAQFRRHPRKGRKPGWRGGWKYARAWKALAGGGIQTDLTMYPGFSGGPLLGSDGKVYGLNTSGFGPGVGMSLPLGVIRKSVAALLADGEVQRGYLGVGIQPARLPDAVADGLEQDSGLLIVSIEADSPAAKAGLLVGDILTALKGDSVEQVDELQIILSGLEIGSEIELGFVRGGRLQQGSITVGARS